MKILDLFIKKTFFRNFKRFLAFFNFSSQKVKKMVCQVKNRFLGKTFLGAPFTKVNCTFLKSVQKEGFFDIPCNLLKEKKIHLIEEAVYELKSPKCRQPLNIL
jgi:hypothetical protein